MHAQETCCCSGVKSPEGHQASDAALRKDLEQAREREEALTARLAAVESELEAARGAKADFLLQIAELKRDKQVRRAPQERPCNSFVLDKRQLTQSQNLDCA